MQSHPFGTHRASYGISPTFLPRTNVAGDYGDNQQEFWMTFSQKDWSLGEQQRFFRQADEESRRRYWVGSAVDVSRPGEVTLARAVADVTAAAAVAACCDGAQGVWFATSTNLYQIGSAGSVSDRGAHGLGAAPAAFGLCSDETNVYLSAAAQAVRKWNGSAFSTFSASGADALAYLNNSLYGFAAGVLYRWDTAGTRSTIYTWKAADGTTATSAGRLAVLGGDLLVLLLAGPSGRGELHLYEGTAPALIAGLPPNFEPWDLTVAYGVAFVSGRFTRSVGGTVEYKPAIFFYASGTIGLLWTQDAWTTTGVQTACNAFGPTVVFNDDVQAALLMYGLDVGGIHTLGGYTVAGSSPLLAGSSYHFLHTRAQTGCYLFPGSGVASTGSLTTSLFDGDSSLPKRFKSVRLDFDAATDGNGGTVDIAYRLNDVDGSYTTLQTGAVAGAEYTIGQDARSISIKVTLNKGTSTAGPRLKRVYVRAAPILDAYRKREYILDLSGRDGAGHIQLRDGTRHGKDGHEMAADLLDAADATAPITVHDRFGSFSGIVDNGFQLVETRPEEYVAVVPVREV